MNYLKDFKGFINEAEDAAQMGPKPKTPQTFEIKYDTDVQKAFEKIKMSGDIGVLKGAKFVAHRGSKAAELVDADGNKYNVEFSQYSSYPVGGSINGQPGEIIWGLNSTLMKETLNYAGEQVKFKIIEELPSGDIDLINPKTLVLPSAGSGYWIGFVSSENNRSYSGNVPYAWIWFKHRDSKMKFKELYVTQ